MEILLLGLAYLLGSIPFALIVGKLAKNIDIRDYGSKNMGATNVVRVLGLKWGLLVFILDMIKAGFIVFLFRFNIISYQNHSLFHPLIYGFFAIIGHLFPIFASFRGGKGVACTAGILLVYQPIVFLIAIISFIIITIITKYVSIGSMISAMIALATAIIIPNQIKYLYPGFYFDESRFDLPFILFCSILVIIIIITHRKNIIRLINKTEGRIDEKPPL